MGKITFLVATFLSVFAVVYSAPPYKCQGVAQYSLAFYGMWSSATHQNAFPANGHFSPLIGCSHEDAYTMWAPGMRASEGVKNVAETGKFVRCGTLFFNFKTDWRK